MTTEPTNREIAEVARKAAEIIQQRGKATYSMQDHLGRVCAHGAIWHASPTGATSVTMSRLIEKHAASAVPLGLVDWNDLPTTTEADIAKVFLQVADDLEVAP